MYIFKDRIKIQRSITHANVKHKSRTFLAQRMIGKNLEGISEKILTAKIIHKTKINNKISLKLSIKGLKSCALG